MGYEVEEWSSFCTCFGRWKWLLEGQDYLKIDELAALHDEGHMSLSNIAIRIEFLCANGMLYKNLVSLAV